MRRVVLKSTTAVYGSSSRDPALFDEAMTPKDLPSGGYAKDAVEIEGYLRGFARRRPDVSVTVLRFANFIGPRIDTVLHPLLRAAGRAHRARLRRPRAAAARGGRARRAGARGEPRDCPACSTSPPTACCCSRRPSAGRAGSRSRCPGPRSARSAGIVRGARLVDFSPEQMRLLNFGRVVDTTRLRTPVRVHPALDHHAGLRRLRARPRAAPRDLARAGRVGGARRARRREGAAVTTTRTAPAPDEPVGEPLCRRPASSRCTPTSPAAARAGA